MQFQAQSVAHKTKLKRKHILNLDPEWHMKCIFLLEEMALRNLKKKKKTSHTNIPQKDALKMLSVAAKHTCQYFACLF